LLLGATALGLRTKNVETYHNCGILTDAFRNGLWPVLRDIVEFQAKIFYLPAADYAESLRTSENVGIRHFPGDTWDLYRRLAYTLLEGVDYSGVNRVLDVGGGEAVNAIALASSHPHLRITVLDRSTAVELARDKIVAAGLVNRIDTYAADGFDDEYPSGYDCLLFVNQLVIWTPEQNRTLLDKARRALVSGGRVLIFNSFADDHAGRLDTAWCDRCAYRLKGNTILSTSTISESWHRRRYPGNRFCRLATISG